MRRRILCCFMIFFMLFSMPVFAYQIDSCNKEIRVGLKNMLSNSINVTLNGSYFFNGQNYTQGTSFVLSIQDGKILFNSVPLDEVALIPNDDTATMTLQTGSKKYDYKGTIIFRVSGENILPVNLINVEDYLKGVVGFEMSNSYPIEALKAQAVVARNYTLISLNKHKNEDFDLCDFTDCQVYRGYDPTIGNVIKAVDDTKGVMLLYENNLVGGYYGASNGGYTESTYNAWGTNLPYLTVQRDDFDNETWAYGQRTYTTTKMDELLKSRGYLSPQELFIKILLDSISKDESGRVSSISILYKDANGVENIKAFTRERARTFLPLPSSYYDVTYDTASDTYIFSGKGNGHGIGLSQVGARNRANAGQSFVDILSFYYSGTYIASMDKDIQAFLLNRNKIFLGDEVTLNVMTAKSSNQYLYKFTIETGGQLIFMRDYDSDASLSYKPGDTGEYVVHLYYKNVNSSNEYDEDKTLNLSVFSPPAIDNLKLSSGEINSGDGITAEITSKGGSSQGVIYTFELVKDGTVVENKIVNSTSCSFTPKQPGQYMIRVKVKDRVSTKDYDDMREIALVVKEALQAPGTATAPATPSVPQNQTTPQTPSVPQAPTQQTSPAFVFTRVLKKGVTGEDVISLQEALKKLGYFNFDKITNYYGDVTCSSVIAFQKMNNLTPNGIVDSKTAELINNILSGYKPPQATPTPSRGSIPPLVVKRTLKKGMTGADVRSLQEILIKLGYFKQKTTGIFATVTENAVKTFQKAAGLKQTGIVDSTTVKKINDRLKQLQG